MTFGSWLEVKDSKYSNLIFERDKILKQHEDYEKHVFAKKAWDSYNKHFSVRNSFFRFLRNVITDDDRNQLFHSIKVYEKPKEESIEYNSATAVEVDLNIKEKEEFLFRIRNNFTHNGISNSDMLGGIMMSIDISKPTLINGKEIWAQVDTELFKEKGKEKYLFSVVKWPYILIEIIENSLQRL